MLTIIGLGPGGLDQLSLGAYRAMEEAEKIYLRTSWHPAAQELGFAYESFDELYEKAQDFESLYREIAELLEEKSRDKKVVYAVPGSPFVAEKTVELLAPLKPRIIPGGSFLDPVCGALGIDFSQGILVQDALEDFKILESVDLILVQIYKKEVASQVKLRLMEAYGDNHPVKIVRAAGTDQESIVQCSLYELDHQDFDHLTSLYVPRSLEPKKNIEGLVGLMEGLLAPGGCPWDRKQTHESLKRYLLEESYEVMEAIDQGDFEALLDELGDLLFQVVFHSALASEEGYFDLGDVIEGSYNKIYSRHTHVFSRDRATSPEEVEKIWESNKKKEQDQKKRIASIPKNSPLHYAQKLKKILGQRRSSDLDEVELVDRLEELVEIALDKDISLDMALMDRMKIVGEQMSATRYSGD